MQASPLSSSRAESSTALTDWEADLSSRLSGVRLLGEINLSEAQFEALCTEIQNLVRRLNRSERLDVLASRYPVCLGVFLVFSGIFNYDQGDYWSAVQRRIGDFGADWGRQFENLVVSQGLETFPEFDEESAQRYVSRILAHGGIPNGCLPDYFALLSYSLRRDDWAPLPAQALIDEWRTRRFSFIQIDRPVQRFLVYGGPTAIDFVQRSLDMVDAALDSGVAPSPDETPLPSRITNAFDQWLRGNQQVKRSPQTQRQRLAPPRITFDPWAGNGLVLELPNEPLTEGASHASWRLVSDGTSWDSHVPTRRAPRAITTEEGELLLPRPAARWDVIFRVDGKERGTWQFSGISSTRPVLAFDPDTWQLVSWVDALPARELWLVYPHTRVLNAEASADRSVSSPVVEEFPPLFGQWSGYRASWVDLSNAARLLLNREDSNEHTAIAVQLTHARAHRPMLDYAEHIVNGVTAQSERLPVVVHPPAIRVPHSAWDNDRDTSRWTIVLTPTAGRSPSERVVRRLSDLAWYEEDNGLVVELCQRAFLSSSSLGTFVVGVRGPLGNDAKFEFALVPGLTVRGHQDPRYLNRGDGEAGTVAINTDVAIDVTAVEPDVVFDRTLTGASVRVVGQHTTIAVAPRDAAHGSARQAVAVELNVPVPSVRWFLTAVNSRETISWATAPVSVPRDQLLETNDAALVVEGFIASWHHDVRHASATVCITLRSATGEQLQRHQAGARGARMAVPLNRFYDTIQDRHDGLFVFELDIWSRDGDHVVARRQVLRVTRTLRLADFALVDQLKHHDEAVYRVLQMRWQQQSRVTGRILRFWSLSRPWHEAVEVEIPDSCNGAFETTVPLQDLPPGQYRVEIDVADDWTLGSPERPSADRTLCDIWLGLSEVRSHVQRPLLDAHDLLEAYLLTGDLEYLEQLQIRIGREPPRTVLDVLTALIDSQDTYDPAGRAMLQPAIQDLRDGIVSHPDLIEILAEWLERAPSMSTPNSGVDSRVSGLWLLANLGLFRQRDSSYLSETSATIGSSLAVVERSFPIFFLMRAGYDLVQSDAERADAELLFGAGELEILLPPLDETRPSRRGWGQRAETILSHFVFRYDARIAEADHIRLEQMREHFVQPEDDLVPSGLFSYQSLFANVLSSMAHLKHPRSEGWRHEVESWVGTAAAHVDSELHRIERYVHERKQQRDVSGIELAQSLIKHRSDARLQGLGVVPHVIGGTALIQRFLARRVGTDYSPGLAQSIWGDHGTQCAIVMPGLYLHDLCFFDLLMITNQSSGPGDEANNDPEE